MQLSVRKKVGKTNWSLVGQKTRPERQDIDAEALLREIAFTRVALSTLT